jgi:REP element-mobilizing transposase RayT
MKVKWSLYFHVVWTTKDRQPLITSELEAYLIPGIFMKAEELKGVVFAVSGMPDHKVFSARAVTLKYDFPFEWQQGYGVFSLSKRSLKRVMEYVERQKDHHHSGKTIGALEHTSDDVLF